ncbi:MAG: hypothetical protein C4547_09560 [Phycisphaerales bacterium]|nr:MAG: hypothetical protein C4547_09560 [Phycisphaerales bacterium]
MATTAPSPTSASVSAGRVVGGATSPTRRRDLGLQITGGRLVLVWLISIGLHALVLFILNQAPWLLGALRPEEELPIALTELVGEVRSAKMSVAPAVDPQDLSRQTPTENPSFQPERFDQVAESTTPRATTLPIVGIGTGGADFSKYGLEGPAAPGPQFFDAGGAKAAGARRIVYVVDRSGSMSGTFALVRAELIESVNRLRRSQKFHVVFFNEGKPLENPPRRLVGAIPSQKEALKAFLDSGEVSPGGGTDPIPAMRRAFDVDPDLIFFLTDGDFSPQLLVKLEEWNADRAVRIFTIAYFSREGAELLERIAREHRGEFRYVDEDHLDGP